MNKKFILFLSIVALLSTGCEKDKAVDKNTVSLAGSTSVTPYAEKIGASFEREFTNVLVDIQGLGSTAGIKAVEEGTVDIGMASRDLDEKEKNLGLTEHIIAYEGIAVITNPKNPVKSLSNSELRKIFEGSITNWSEVGGPDKRIIVVSREAGSGTRGAFDELVGALRESEGKKISTVTKEALVADGNGSVRQNISGKDFAIGYISIGYLDKSVNGLILDDIAPTIENVKLKQYKLARPFLMLTKGNLKSHAKDYLDFVLSEKGQEIIKQEGAVPVN